MTSAINTGELSDSVDAELNRIINIREVPLYGMMSYHMGWTEGENVPRSASVRERVHGVLCMLAAQAFGADSSNAIPAAAAVELVHNFTLIHDDVQGGNPQRDNRDAVWWVWGPAQAINAGDGMHALARLALFGLLEKGVSNEALFEAVHVMDESSLKACEGRFMDLEAQERIDLSLDAYLKMARSKTGALLSCALRLGGIVASRDEDSLTSLGECGEHLGIVAQIRSDLNELWGSDTANVEILNKKKLLPVVYAMEKADFGQKRRLGEIYFKRVLDKDDAAKLRETLEEIGVRDACESLADEHTASAVTALEASGVSDIGASDIKSYFSSLIGLGS